MRPVSVDLRVKRQIRGSMTSEAQTYDLQYVNNMSLNICTDDRKCVESHNSSVQPELYSRTLHVTSSMTTGLDSRGMQNTRSFPTHPVHCQLHVAFDALFCKQLSQLSSIGDCTHEQETPANKGSDHALGAQSDTCSCIRFRIDESVRQRSLWVIAFSMS